MPLESAMSKPYHRAYKQEDLVLEDSERTQALARYVTPLKGALRFGYFWLIPCFVGSSRCPLSFT